MSFKLIIREKAETHISEAYNWYEARQPGLGDKFISHIEATINYIEENPLHFQLRYKNIRCAKVDVFPYGIFYVVNSTDIVVFAVFHSMRDPKAWKK